MFSSCPASFSQHKIFEIHLCVACISTSCFSWLDNIPLYEYTTICLSIVCIPVFFQPITNHSKLSDFQKLTTIYFTHECAPRAWHGEIGSPCSPWHQLAQLKDWRVLMASSQNYLKTDSCTWWLMLAVSWSLSWGLGFLIASQLGSKNKHPKGIRQKGRGIFMNQPQKSQSIIFFTLYWPSQS